MKNIFCNKTIKAILILFIKIECISILINPLDLIYGRYYLFIQLVEKNRYYMYV